MPASWAKKIGRAKSCNFSTDISVKFRRKRLWLHAHNFNLASVFKWEFSALEFAFLTKTFWQKNFFRQFFDNPKLIGVNYPSPVSPAMHDATSWSHYGFEILFSFITSRWEDALDWSLLALSGKTNVALQEKNIFSLRGYRQNTSLSALSSWPSSLGNKQRPFADIRYWLASTQKKSSEILCNISADASAIFMIIFFRW